MRPWYATSRYERRDKFLDLNRLTCNCPWDEGTENSLFKPMPRLRSNIPFA